MSARNPIADIDRPLSTIRFVPKPDLLTLSGEG
jgi:hypothetical protein